MGRSDDFRVLFIIRHALIGSDPIGIMQLSAIAKQQGCITRLALAGDNCPATVRSFRPDLIAVSMMSTDVVALRGEVGRIKSQHPGIPLVIGGPHPTFRPEILQTTEADAVCIGEGDKAVVEIIERAKRKAGLHDVANVHTHDFKNPVGRLVENLDALPFVDREVLYDRLPEVRRFKLRNFLASRGCPYSCSYCFNHSYNRIYRGLGRLVRRRSVDHLIAEIEEVCGHYPTEFVKFSDDSFVHQVDPWLEEFCRKYKRRIGLPFYCLIRPDRVTEEMVRLLRYAGCHSVFMSIETGNERLRKDVLKRDISDRQLIAAFDLFNRYGVRISTNSMLGIPTGTRQNDIETLKLNIRCRPSSCGFSICVPYPGTDIHRLCEENKLLAADSSGHESAPDMNDFSILTTFDEKDRCIQKNLSLLGVLAVKAPTVAPTILRYLIGLPTNALFYAVHFFVSWHSIKKHIIPMRYSLTDWLIFGKRIIAESLRNVKFARRQRSV